MKLLSLLLVVVFCFSGLAFGEQLKTKVEAAPKVVTVTPNDRASLAASKYPSFENYSGNAACGRTLAGYSMTYKHRAPSFTDVPGLSLDLPIPDAYRENGSILITWTIRIEGEDARPVNIFEGGLCGTLEDGESRVDQVFKGGLVQTQAYVDMGSTFRGLLGSPSGMTLPDGGYVTSVSPEPPPPPRDPTHSGSYLIKAADYGGLPATAKIKIQWKNDTCLDIYSKAKYRSLMVTLLPTS